jgi:HK97 family phage prohead protease
MTLQLVPAMSAQTLLLEDAVSPFAVYVPIEKMDKKQQVIAGYASVKGIDLQNDLIPIPALKEAWEGFIKNLDYAHIHILHSNIPVGKVLLEHTDSEGKLWKSGVDDIGLFIVVKIRDDIKKAREVWKLIEKGVLKGFSIGGEAISKITVKKEGGFEFNRIDKLELHEISVVDNPANQLSLFQIVKNAVPLSKLKEIQKMKIEDVKTKLLTLYEERRAIDKQLYPSEVKMATEESPIGVAQEQTSTLSEAKRRELCDKRSLLNLEIWAMEDGLRQKIIDTVKKMNEAVTNVSVNINADGVDVSKICELVNKEIRKHLGQTEDSELPVSKEAEITAQEGAGGFTPSDVVKNEPSNSITKGEPQVTEEKKEVKKEETPAAPVAKEVSNAEVLAELQKLNSILTDGFSKMQAKLESAAPLEKKEEKVEKKEGTEEKPVEKAKDCDEDKDKEEEKAASKTNIDELVKAEVAKRLEELGLPTEKKSVAPAAGGSDIKKVKDPLAMSLKDLNDIPLKRIMKGKEF